MNNLHFDADIAVIGAGTAGLNAFDAIDASGKSVLLIDPGPLGTMCARVGCMPSKAVLHAGHRMSVVRELMGEAAADAALRRRLWSQALAFRDRMAGGAADSTRERAGDRLVCGSARFVDGQTIDVDGRRLRARAFVVAVGSSPVVPGPFAALGELVLTTDSLFELTELPERIGVVGAGAVGIEMGLALARLGLAVTVGDDAEAPADIGDAAVASRAIERFGHELDLWLGEKVTARRHGSGVRMTSGSKEVVVDRLLVAVGRKPNLETLALERAGIELDDHGRADVDPESLRCGRTALFIAGDASANTPLLHEAIDDGTIAARQAMALVAGRDGQRFERRTPLSIVFSDPDVAAVGRPFARLDQGSTVIGTADASDNGRSILLDGECGLLRLYADRGNGRLLGAAVFARRGEHLAHFLAAAVQRGETIGSLLQQPFYHPTVEEMIRAAAQDAAAKLVVSVDASGLTKAGAGS